MRRAVRRLVMVAANKLRAPLEMTDVTVTIASQTRLPISKISKGHNSRASISNRCAITTVKGWEIDNSHPRVHHMVRLEDRTAILKIVVTHKTVEIHSRCA